MDQTTVSMVAAVGSICTVVFGGIGYLVGTKKDSLREGKEKGFIESNIKNIEADIGNMKGLEANISNMQMNISYITKQNDNLLFEQREANKNHNALAERVTRVEESAKSAHKRLDTIEEKGVG